MVSAISGGVAADLLLEISIAMDGEVPSPPKALARRLDVSPAVFP